MGLFDFFKTKPPAESFQQNNTDRVECDISRTKIIVELFEAAKEQRDDKWNQTFLENVSMASFTCGNPQVNIGPDGFPYFVLKTPEPGQSFDSFCIRNLKNVLLDKGFGVVINPDVNTVGWVFSYGDIVNYHLKNEFYSQSTNVEIKPIDKLEKEEEILIAQPSELYLPSQARKIIKKHLQEKGISHPKIMMVCRKIEGTVVQELAFNIFREDFSTLDPMNNLIRPLSWFLPKDYIIISIPRDSNITAHFCDL
jgi:hypothetical protein